MTARTQDVMLRPGALPLHREPGGMQFGTDPRWAVLLTGLSPAQERWLSGVRPGAGLPASTDDDVAALARVLDEALLVVPRRDRRRRPVSAPGCGGADLPVLSAVRPDAAGRRTLEARAGAVVGISGLGRLGAMVATVLATAGVGTLLLDDPGPVLPTDVGLGAYRLGDVGMAREDAARRAIAEVSPAVVTEAAAQVADPDVVVVVEHRVADPERVRRLMGEGVPHLSVVVREADVVVGPFVRPGSTPCLRCLDLDREERDPSWPRVARQLRELKGEALEETLLAASAASIAAGQVLAALDGAVPRTAAACIEIPAPDAMPRLRETARHPRCGCADPGAAHPATAVRPVKTVDSVMSGRRRD